MAAKKKLKVIETKKTNRQLKCILTKEELLVKGKQAAEKTIELGALEQDKKRIMDDFKAKISGVEADLGILANAVNTGTEFRSVECIEYFGDPSPEKKRIVRQDTGDEVGVEFMSSTEMQRELQIANQGDDDGGETSKD